METLPIVGVLVGIMFLLAFVSSNVSRVADALERRNELLLNKK